MDCREPRLERDGLDAAQCRRRPVDLARQAFHYAARQLLVVPKQPNLERHVAQAYSVAVQHNPHLRQ